LAAYIVKFEDLRIGGMPYRMRSLLDRQQFFDDDGRAERLGISPAMWPLFGLLWPSGCVLAEQLSRIDLFGRRVLEVGCGLGLASLVAHARGADVTASDIHPLAGAFLQINAALNRLPPIRFHRGDWRDIDADLGHFDLLVGSDLLYDRSLPDALAGFVGRHAEPASEFMLVDPDRGMQGRFRRLMDARGYHHAARVVARHDTPGGSFKGRVHTYTRASDEPSERA
jgi:predicted nicotinamide N-methyase